MTIRPTLAALAFATTAFVAAFSPTTASAGDAVCGVYAFGGAFQSYRNAVDRANRIGGVVLNLDRSNSPNAGLGYHVVAKGPQDYRGQASRWARNWRHQGVRGAYTANRCFYISYNN